MGDMNDAAKSEAALEKALQGVHLAVIPAGVPRKPGMTRDDLFNINAGGNLPYLSPSKRAEAVAVCLTQQACRDHHQEWSGRGRPGTEWGVQSYVVRCLLDPLAP